MMINITINSKQVKVKKNTTVIQACSKLNIQIPRFCYHPKLSIAGNCRICLVEIKNAPKLIASCAMPVSENMVIETNSMNVKRAREDVIELLLINHPLDCPICDQGGECDLQDQTMSYGNHRGRFNEYKRAVTDKDCGPLINTIMTRCIHCTRCVRFSTEVAGVQEMGTTGRGSHMEIGTYINQTLQSELSGNMIDLCPVGAITSKPYAYTARPWELESIESIDIFDGIGSNIRVDVRGKDIMRILPKHNKNINEEWISDKIRFCFDGLKNQRIDTPMLYLDKWNILSPTNWTKILNEFVSNSNITKQMKGIAGNTVDSETLLVFKEFVNSVGSSDLYTMNPQISPDFRNNYITNESLDTILESDNLLLIGTNLRTEAPVLNARIRKQVFKKKMKVFSIGCSLDLGVEHKQIGNTIETLIKVVNGTHPICQKLLKSTSITILIGSSIINTKNFRLISLAIKELNKYIKVNISILQPNSNGASALEIGYPSVKHNSKYYNQYSLNHNNILYYFLNTNNLNIQEKKENDYIVYQGHHGYKLTQIHANIILPGTTFLEKDSLYMNTEGRVQQTKIILDKVNNAIQDWKILKGISQWFVWTISTKLMKTRNIKDIEYNNIYDIRKSLCNISNIFDYVDFRVKTKIKFREDKNTKYSLRIKNSLVKNRYITSNNRPSIINYFNNSLISKASISLLKRSKIQQNQSR
jgi:NADH dehydrogenase (ubiquinone) Fe-S protein 1